MKKPVSKFAFQTQPAALHPGCHSIGHTDPTPGCRHLAIWTVRSARVAATSGCRVGHVEHVYRLSSRLIVGVLNASEAQSWTEGHRTFPRIAKQLSLHLSTLGAAPFDGCRYVGTGENERGWLTGPARAGITGMVDRCKKEEQKKTLRHACQPCLAAATARAFAYARVPPPPPPRTSHPMTPHSARG